MKIAFINITPSNQLSKALLSSGFTTLLLKKLNLSKAASPYDIIAFWPKIPADLKELKAVRKKAPQAWIVLVVDRHWLKDPSLQNALLACREKNDVLALELWEQTFWFSLQNAQGIKQLSLSLTQTQAECESLKNHYQELSSSSNKLIQQLEKDVGLAADIQRSLLPTISPEIPGLSVSVKYLPATGVGGDYYDLFDLGDRKRVGVLLADSKTHGMAAALLSVLLKVRIEKMKDRFPNSNSFVEFLNQEIQSFHEKDLAPLSLLYGIFDRSSLTFQYTSAGPLTPILWRQGTSISLPISNNPPLGGMNQYSFREAMTPLQPGDLLILHTDGLNAPLTTGLENCSAFDRIVEILGRKPASPDPIEIQMELLGIIDRFVEKTPLPDDLTLIQFAVDAKALYVAKNLA